MREYDNYFKSESRVYHNETNRIKLSILSPIHIVAESGLCDVETNFRVMCC